MLQMERFYYNMGCRIKDDLASINLLKINNKNTRIGCEISSK